MNRKIREKGGEIYPTGLTMEEAANFLVEKEHSRDHLKREFTKIINGEEGSRFANESTVNIAVSNLFSPK